MELLSLTKKTPLSLSFSRILLVSVRVNWPKYQLEKQIIEFIQCNTVQLNDLQKTSNRENKQGNFYKMNRGACFLIEISIVDDMQPGMQPCEVLSMPYLVLTINKWHLDFLSPF
ncbi:unnamed protein product, partial [Owenia fusiformis]